jgi:superfamily I DNA and RNA helicase
MALEIVYGEPRDRAAATHLAHVLEQHVAEGTLYIGYPVLATADERVEVDALLVSASHGVVAILIADALPQSPEGWESVVAEQDTLFAVLESHLRRHERLRRGRALAFQPQTATVFSTWRNGAEPAVAEGFYGDLDHLPGWLDGLDGLEPELAVAVQAALQRVTTIKPPKRRASVERPGSRGAALKEIEKAIANLDTWQKRAAIESPDGPQRIRGLAGSGKTVVIALKAAYWHTQHPEWNIALTFLAPCTSRSTTWSPASPSSTATIALILNGCGSFMPGVQPPATAYTA